MRQQGMSGWHGVPAGLCRAWPLPTDETCAGIARRLFREAVAQLGLEPAVVDDATLMASELAANTLHANAAAHARSAPYPDAEPCQPELWLYLRGVGLGRELVCKVFDCYRGWRDGTAPSVSETPPETPADAVGGRGLQIVHELSGGRWGHHPTRARLDSWGLRGKAVWFAVPAPLAHARLVDVTGLRSYTFSADVTAARASDRLSARQAVRELEAMLDERGFGRGLVRDDQPARDMSILSVRRGLTVWCQAGVVSLTTPWGSSQRWNYGDLVEAAEQTVRRYEELDQAQDPLRAP